LYYPYIDMITMGIDASGPPILGNYPIWLGLAMQDSSGQAFEKGTWDNMTWTLSFNMPPTTGGGRVMGNLLSFNLVPESQVVPEPSTLFLYLAGILCLGAARLVIVGGSRTANPRLR